MQQSLMERVEAIRETGLADEIIIEEYEGQKIDDIRRYDVDILTYPEYSLCQLSSIWTNPYPVLILEHGKNIISRCV